MTPDATTRRSGESYSDTTYDEPYRWRPGDDESLLDTTAVSTPSTVTGTDEGDEGPSHPHDETDRKIDKHGVFRQSIQKDPEICASCFLQNYDVLYPHSERRSTNESLVRYFVPAQDTTESVAPAAETGSNPPRACQCGRLGPLRDRPLPRSRAVDYAWNLSLTLTRKEIRHNPLVLVAEVLHRKGIRPMASRDDQNFDAAVARSLPSFRHDMRDYLNPTRTDDTPALPPAEDDARRFARHRTVLPSR